MLGSMLSLTVVLFPVLLMLFALSMERVEARLRRIGAEDDLLGEEAVGQFLDQASEDEVDTMVREGLPRALDLFRRRRHHANRRPLRVSARRPTRSRSRRT